MAYTFISVQGTVRYYDEQNRLGSKIQPAAQYADGTMVWYDMNVYHREDGPAYDLPNGYKIDYILGDMIWPTL